LCFVSAKESLRWLLRRAGYEISRLDVRNAAVRRKLLVRHYGIKTVLDVGANIGQFAVHMKRDIGFDGRIISFEPMTSAFVTLKQRATKDPQWQAHQFGLGDANKRMRFNISRNSLSSSLLPALPSLLSAAPDAMKVGEEEIEVRTLDSVFDSLACQAPIYLKMDVQGFERKVLDGAKHALEHIDTIQLEMALTPVYVGASGFLEITGFPVHSVTSWLRWSRASPTREPDSCSRWTGPSTGPSRPTTDARKPWGNFPA
jgi:FkbM family methyltransferase